MAADQFCFAPQLPQKTAEDGSLPPHETQYLNDSVGSVGFDVADWELTGAGAPHVGQNL